MENGIVVTSTVVWNVSVQYVRYDEGGRAVACIQELRQYSGVCDGDVRGLHRPTITVSTARGIEGAIGGGMSRDEEP